MKIFYRLSFLLLALPVISSAQGNYKPGFVVTSGGDTVKGTVLYRKWSENPSKFSFKNNKGESRVLNTGNAATVCINGHAVYKCFTVWVSQDRYADLNFIAGTDMAIGIDSTKKLDTVFLKMISAGKNVSLYSYTDFTKQRFFIADKNTAPVELVLHKYFEQEPKLILIEDKKYKIQLQVLRAVYAPGNTSLTDEIQLAEYNESDLVSIVRKLNGN